MTDLSNRRTHFKPKLSWLAWGFFLLVCLVTAQSLILKFSVQNLNKGLAYILSDLVLEGLIPIVFSLVGALIVSRKSHNLIGWLLFGPILILILTRMVLPDYASWTVAPPNMNLLDYIGIWFTGGNWLLLIFPIFAIMLLFPTGRPPSRRWNFVGYLMLGMVGVFLLWTTFSKTFTIEESELIFPNPIGFIPLETEPYFLVVWGICLLSLAVSSVVSLVVRYRQSFLVERAQIKWLVFACSLFGVTYALGLVFFGGVTLLQYIFGRLSGTESSPAAIVISTLVIAALFNPLRRSVQDFIDRRFYRRKYNAEKALLQFAAQARNETQVDRLGSELVSVVQETMQPESVELWLKPGRRK